MTSFWGLRKDPRQQGRLSYNLKVSPNFSNKKGHFLSAFVKSNNVSNILTVKCSLTMSSIRTRRRESWLFWCEAEVDWPDRRYRLQRTGSEAVSSLKLCFSLRFRFDEGSPGENSALLDILTICVSNIDAKVTQLNLAAHFQIVGDIKKPTLGKDPETGFSNNG